MAKDVDGLESADAMLNQSGVGQASEIVVKAFMSFIPGAGSLTSDFYGMRQQRMIKEVMQIVIQRLKDVESIIERFHNNEATQDLFFEAMAQVTISSHPLRKMTLARITADFLSEKTPDHEIDRLMLAILKDLTDYELLHLISHMSAMSRRKLDPEYKSLIDQHTELVEPRSAHLGSDQSAVDALTAQDSHKRRLVKLELMEQRQHGYSTTPLGRLFLRRIGAISEID